MHKLQVMQKLRVLVFLLLSMIFLQGCTSCKGCQSSAKVEDEVSIEKELVDRGMPTFLVTGDWPCDQWWEMFEDPQLTSFIQTALAENPNLKSIEARVRRANQEAFIARSKLFPTLSAAMQIFLAYFPKEVVDAIFPNYRQQFHLYNVPLNFSYEFDFWRKNRNTYSAALGEANVQKMEKYQADLVLSASVAKLYFNIQADMIKLEILEQILANRARRLELVRVRKLHRIDSQVNINQMTGEISSLQETLASMKETLELEKNLLNVLLGKGPSEELYFSAQWKTYCRPVAVPEDAGINLIARRPDLMAGIWSLYKSAKLIGVSAANFYPNVAVKSFAGFQSLKYQDLFEGDTLTGILIPYFDVPIFTGGRLRASLRARVAEYETAVYNFNETLLQAGKTVADAVVKCNAVEEKMAYQNENLTSTKSNYELMYIRYRHGIESMISVLSSDENYLWSRIKQIELDRSKYESMIELVKSLGGGFEDSQGSKVLKEE